MAYLRQCLLEVRRAMGELHEGSFHIKELNLTGTPSEPHAPGDAFTHLQTIENESLQCGSSET